MDIRAYIFDLDGTLVDTELVWANATHLFLADQGCACSPEEVLAMVFGRSWGDIYAEITRRYPHMGAVTMLEMAAGLREYYLRVRQQDEDNVIIASSVALLKTLAQSGTPVIIVSGSPRDDIMEALELIGAKEHVRFILGTEDYAPGKPAPAGFLKGAELLGVPPANCVVFEDSSAGVAAAKAAGMWCVALRRPCAFPQNLAAADWVLEDLAHFSPAGLARQCKAE